MKTFLLYVLFLPLLLFARPVDTFYGTIEVEEPVLLELIDCEAMQRLKDVRQYGVAYYTSHNEEYNRFDHSIGVFAILRMHNASLKEQVAGLLHDVSHTVFSHVGDWIFETYYREKDYQNQIHAKFLQERGIEVILQKHGISISEIMPTAELFPALECSLPRLSADRIDYNIQGAYHQGFITHEEAIEIVHGLKFTGGIWVSNNPELMEKLALFSLFMTEECWGSPTNFLESRWLADAILRACEIGTLSLEDIHFGTDDQVWSILEKDKDPIICQKMHYVKHAKKMYRLTSDKTADLTIRSKFRGINPYIKEGDRVSDLLELKPEFAKRYKETKSRFQIGWSVELLKPEISLNSSN